VFRDRERADDQIVEHEGVAVIRRAIGPREASTRQCEVRGNEYDKAFEVVAADRRHIFDGFECAIRSPR